MTTGPDTPDADPFVTVDEFAAETRMARQTVYNRRSLGTAPRGTRIGGRVLMRRSDVDAWLDTQPSDPSGADR